MKQYNDKADPRAGTKSLEGAIAVLLVFSDASRPLGVTEIATKLNVHKSTVSRQLAALARFGLVEREPGSARYTLGVGLLPIAAAVLAGHRLSSTARRYLENLAQEVSETVTLSGWNGRDAVNLEQIRGPATLQHIAPPGRLNPAHCTATGKAFLSTLPDEELWARLSEPLQPYTAATIVDPTVLLAELQQVRRDGYAISRDEFIQGSCSVSSVVRASGRGKIHAVAITMPTFRATEEKLSLAKQAVLFTAQQLSELDTSVFETFAATG